MQNYLLSVITVVKNDEKNIIQTLKSVKNQTYTNFEYIIVDGASTDGTFDLVSEYLISKSFISV